MSAGSSQERAARLVRMHGREATSAQVLDEGFHHWFVGHEGLVAYVDVAGTWVAAGGPVAAPSQRADVAAAFVAAARDGDRRAVFFASADAIPGLEATAIGEEAWWRTDTWDTTLRAVPKLREQLRRARAKHVRVREAPAGGDAALRDGIEAVVARWRAAQGLPPMGFLVRLAPFARRHERRLFVAERGGAVVAFAVVLPMAARGALFVESLVRDRAAPNGTVELLVDAVMRSAAAEGREWVTLGLAPLAGDAVPAALAAFRMLGRPLYDFDGLRAFRSRLRPSTWEPRYLLRPKRTSVVTAFRAVLAAFAEDGLGRFGARAVRGLFP